MTVIVSTAIRANRRAGIIQLSSAKQDRSSLLHLSSAYIYIRQRRLFASASPSGRPTVAVIGAGVVGLVQAKVLADDGFKVTVFTRDKSVGGTWNSDRIYPGLRTNSVSGQFCLSHLPQRPSTNKNDRQLLGRDLCSYVNEYSQHFVESHNNVTMRFQVEVEKLWRQDEHRGAWKLKTKDVGDVEGSNDVLEFDKVVLCTGGASRPSIPSDLSVTLPKFKGLSFHSASYHEHSSRILEDARRNGPKRVVVVGGGKSAQDAATFFSNNGQHVEMIFDKIDAFTAAPFPLPDFVRKSRFLSVFAGHIRLRTRLERFLHLTTIGSKLVAAFGAFMRWSAYDTFKIPRDSPLRNAPQMFWTLKFADEGAGAPNNFFNNAVAGRIGIKFAPSRAVGFGDDGKSVLIKKKLRDGTYGEEISVPADIVILATGHASSWSHLFEASFADELGISRIPPPKQEKYTWDHYKTLRNPPSAPVQDDWCAYLYRGVVPASTIDRRDFAVNGAVFNTNIGYVSETSAHWISSYFLKDPFMFVPSAPVAIEECKKTAAWYRIRTPGGLRWGNESTAGGLALLNWPQYTDELMEDMGLRGMRSVPPGILSWLLWPFLTIRNDELASLGRERAQMRELGNDSAVEKAELPNPSKFGASGGYQVRERVA